MPTLSNAGYGTTTEPTQADIQAAKQKRVDSGADSMSDEQLKQAAIAAASKQHVTTNTSFAAGQYATEVVDLPSTGYFYPESNVLSSGRLEMKYMTAREEDILASPNLVKQGVVLDKLFQSLIVTPINYDDILIGDRDAIMVAARLLSYGASYPIEVTDPSFPSVKQKVEVDLSTLKPKSINFDEFERGQTEFTFVCPASKHTLTFRFLTIGIERQIKADVKVQEKLKKNDGIDRELSTRFKHIITSVDGDTRQTVINDFVDNQFYARDSRQFREYYKSVSPGVDFSVQFESEMTGEVVEVEVPIDINFFWPR